MVRVSRTKKRLSFYCRNGIRIIFTCVMLKMVSDEQLSLPQTQCELRKCNHRTLQIQNTKIHISYSLFSIIYYLSEDHKVYSWTKQNSISYSTKGVLLLLKIHDRSPSKQYDLSSRLINFSATFFINKEYIIEHHSIVFKIQSQKEIIRHLLLLTLNDLQ